MLSIDVIYWIRADHEANPQLIPLLCVTPMNVYVEPFRSQIVCKEGYSLHNGGMTCGLKGRWNHISECSESFCVQPNISDGWSFSIRLSLVDKSTYYPLCIKINQFNYINMIYYFIHIEIKIRFI